MDRDDHVPPHERELTRLMIISGGLSFGLIVACGVGLGMVMLGAENAVSGAIMSGIGTAGLAAWGMSKSRRVREMLGRLYFAIIRNI